MPVRSRLVRLSAMILVLVAGLHVFSFLAGGASAASRVVLGSTSELVHSRTAFHYDAASSTTMVTVNLSALPGYNAGAHKPCIGVEVGGSGNNVLIATTEVGDTPPSDLTAPTDGVLSTVSIVYPFATRPAPVYCGRFSHFSYEAASGTPPVDLRILY